MNHLHNIIMQTDEYIMLQSAYLECIILRSFYYYSKSIHQYVFTSTFTFTSSEYQLYFFLWMTNSTGPSVQRIGPRSQSWWQEANVGTVISSIWDRASHMLPCTPSAYLCYLSRHGLCSLCCAVSLRGGNFYPDHPIWKGRSNQKRGTSSSGTCVFQKTLIYT